MRSWQPGVPLPQAGSSKPGSGKKRTPKPVEASTEQPRSVSNFLTAFSLNILLFLAMVMLVNVLYAGYDVSVIEWDSLFQLDPSNGTLAQWLLWTVGVVFCLFVFDSAILVSLRLFTLAINSFRTHVLKQAPPYVPTMQSLRQRANARPKTADQARTATGPVDHRTGLAGLVEAGSSLGPLTIVLEQEEKHESADTSQPVVVGTADYTSTLSLPSPTRLHRVTSESSLSLSGAIPLLPLGGPPSSPVNAHANSLGKPSGSSSLDLSDERSTNSPSPNEPVMVLAPTAAVPSVMAGPEVSTNDDMEDLQSMSMIGVSSPPQRQSIFGARGPFSASSEHGSGATSPAAPAGHRVASIGHMRSASGAFVTVDFGAIRSEASMTDSPPTSTPSLVDFYRVQPKAAPNGAETAWRPVKGTLAEADREDAAAFEEVNDDDDDSTDHYPFVVVQLPMYNEANVARRVISLSCQLDWPRDKLLIQVLDDSTSAAVRAAVDDEVAIQQQHGAPVELRRRENRRGFKAGALNDSFEFVQKYKYIAVLDADFVPSPSFLMDTIPHLEDNPNMAFVQARWSYLNADESILTKVQDINLEFHHWVEQKVRSDFGFFFNFCGTAGVIRKEALVAIGGWSEKTIVEDMEMSLRMYSKGWQLKFLDDVHVPCELPSDYKAFFTQQRRWTAGPLRILSSQLTWSLIWRDSKMSFFQKIVTTIFFLRMVKSMANVLLILVAVPISVFWNEGLLHLYLYTVIPLVVTILSVAYSSPRSLIYLPAYMMFEIGFCFYRFKSVLVGIFHGHHSQTWVVTFKSGGLVSAATSQAASAQKLKKKGGKIRFAELILSGFMFYVAVVSFQQRLFSFSAVIFLISISFFWVGVCQMSSVTDLCNANSLRQSIKGRRRCIQPQILVTAIFSFLMIGAYHGFWFLYKDPRLDLDMNYVNNFVRARGTEFAAGNMTYRLGGANLYYAGYEDMFYMSRILRDLSAARFKVVRTWGFLDVGKPDLGQLEDVGSVDGKKRSVYYQAWDEGLQKPLVHDDKYLGLGKLDALIAEVGRLGMKIILCLTNNWVQHGGVNQYVRWRQWQLSGSRNRRVSDAALLSHDDFFSESGLKQMYKDYVRSILLRTNSITGVLYKDDPTIFSWELINEPFCDSVLFNVTDAKCNDTTIFNWGVEMVDYVRSIDSNHMISQDLPTNEPLLDPVMRSSLRLDYASFHAWMTSAEARESAEAVSGFARSLNDISMLPRAITEFGFRDDRFSGRPVTTNSTQAALYRYFLETGIVQNNVSMFLFWFYGGDGGTIGDSYAAANFDTFGVYARNETFKVLQNVLATNPYFTPQPIQEL